MGTKTTEVFVVNQEDGKFNLYHGESNTMLLSFGGDATAQEALVTANGLVGKSRSAILKNIKSDSSEANKKFYTDIANVLHPAKESAPLLPKTKTRDSYTSGARQSFKPTANVTAKEELILNAIEEAANSKNQATPTYVAGIAGLEKNAVNGSISVLLAKGIVSSSRVKPVGGGKATREFAIIFKDWRNLVGKAESEAKLEATAKAKKRAEEVAKNQAAKKAAKKAKNADKTEKATKGAKEAESAEAPVEAK